MSRRVTSRGRVEAVEAFEQSIGALGAKLGPVRVKVPQARDDGFLRLLVDSLSPEIRYVLDFRHESWDAADVSAVLAARGMARANDLEGDAPFRYLRLREPPYEDADLAEWAARLQPLLASGLDVYCYFKHEDDPTAPLYAEQLIALADSSAG